MNADDKLVQWEARQQALRAEAERRRADVLHDYRLLRKIALDEGHWLRTRIKLAQETKDRLSVRSVRRLVQGTNRATAAALRARQLAGLGARLTERVLLRLELMGAL